MFLRVRGQLSAEIETKSEIMGCWFRAYNLIPSNWILILIPHSLSEKYWVFLVSLIPFMVSKISGASSKNNNKTEAY